MAHRNLPPYITHFSHPHPLLLCNPSTNPYPPGTRILCDVCDHDVTSPWFYRCADCGFDVHLHCPPTTARSPAPGQPIHQPAMQMPAPAQPIHQPVMHVPAPAQPIHQTAMFMQTPAQPIHQPAMHMPVSAQPIHQAAMHMPVPAQPMHVRPTRRQQPITKAGRSNWSIANTALITATIGMAVQTAGHAILPEPHLNHHQDHRDQDDYDHDHDHYDHHYHNHDDHNNDYSYEYEYDDHDHYHHDDDHYNHDDVYQYD